MCRRGADTFDLVLELTIHPAPFSVGGPQELWTDPHVQQQMLRFHLDPDAEAPSRTRDFIERSTVWIVDALDIHSRTRVLDLGCGPGLYANALVERAGRVQGIDLSAASVREARRRATSHRAHFEVGDYLTAALPEHDVALFIGCDDCAMSPGDRQRLLRRVRARMAPTGGSCSTCTPRSATRPSPRAAGSGIG